MVLAGRADTWAIEERLAEINALPTDSKTRREDYLQGREVLTSDVAAERRRLEALYEIALAKEYGAPPGELSDLIAGHFAPDPNADLKLAGEIVAGMVPGLQQLQALEDAGVSVEAMQTALENGDLAAASEAGLYGFLSVLGGVPAAGKVANILRGALKRAAPAVRGADGVLMQRNIQFGGWIDRIAASGGKAAGNAKPVGKMTPEIEAFVRAQGKDPGDGRIMLTDHSVVHMMRDAKAQRDQATPLDDLQRLPEHMSEPERVLWDKDDHALLYVFDVPSVGKKGKIVVRVEFRTKFRLEGEVSSSKKTRNVVRTSGVLQAANLQEGRYHTITEN